MSKNSKIRAAIIGASGYTGVELIRLLLNHPKVEISYLAANKNAGKTMDAIYDHLKPYNLPQITKTDDIKWANIDIAFFCLPHATAQEIINTVPKRVKVIDLSADFRLFNTDTYKKWYGKEHAAPELQKSAVYGLTELFREPIKSARIVACPGCYPTGALLPLVPLLRQHVIENDDIIIDSKSGVTGAGRSVSQQNLFTEINDSTKAYSICKHRHIPEIEQILGAAAGADITINFSPTLVPMNRGILTNIYVKLARDYRSKDVRESLETRYKNENFVTVLEKGQLPSTKDAFGTNNCIISVTRGRTPDRAVITSVIDNLVKGASGQAVQNMNLMFGIKENIGLEMTPTFP